MKASTLVIFMGIALMLLFGYSHEQVHVEINRHYGIESTVDYWNPPSFAFITWGEAPCSSDQCILAHNNNDAIAYNFLPFFVFFFFVSVILISILEDK